MPSRQRPEGTRPIPPDNVSSGQPTKTVQDGTKTQISIVTICMDNPSALWLTCASVARQTHRPQQHVIVDSSAIDQKKNMRAIARNFDAQYRWVSPSGPYGAMAEGLRHLSENNYVIFLNATDWFAGSNTLELISESIRSTLAMGEVFAWGVGKTVVHDNGFTYFLKNARTAEKVLRSLFRGTIGLAHPSMVCKVADVRAEEVFRAPWRLSLDLELALRLGKRIGPPLLLDFPVSYYDQTGLSGLNPFNTFASKAVSRQKVLGWPSLFWLANSMVWTTLRATLRRLPDSQPRRIALKVAGWQEFSMKPNRHFCEQGDDRVFPNCCVSSLSDRVSYSHIVSDGEDPPIFAKSAETRTKREIQ